MWYGGGEVNTMPRGKPIYDKHGRSIRVSPETYAKIQSLRNHMAGKQPEERQIRVTIGDVLEAAVDALGARMGA